MQFPTTEAQNTVIQGFMANGKFPGSMLTCSCIQVFPQEE